MKKITIYLDDEIEMKAKRMAEKSQISVNQWIKNLVMEKLSDEWPQDVIDLAGAWKDFPTLEEIRSTDQNLVK